MKKHRLNVLSVLLVLLTGVISKADVTLPSIVGDGMVLQQQMPAPIWGWANPGEKVTVAFEKQKKTVVADSNGKWRVTLEPLAANSNGQTLTVAGDNKISVSDVLVGEVWICSGQSNMEWSCLLYTSPSPRD